MRQLASATLALAVLGLAAPRGMMAQSAGKPAADPVAADTASPFHPHPDLFVRGLSATVELGGRASMRDLTPRQMGKLTEYKDLPTGAVLHSLLLTYTPDDTVRHYEFAAARIGQLDQTMGLRAYEPAKFDFRLRWDRIPHTYSTTARMAGSETMPGVLSLPTPRPDTAAWNASPYLGPIRARWDPVKASLALSPSKAWDTKAEYTRVTKVGERPMGMSFGNSPGNNSREILEPLDQTMHDLRLSESFASTDVQMVLSYQLSLFRNGLQSVTSDNPQATSDSPTAGSARGRGALAPNNVAHSAMFAGGANLPMRTRVTASGSYSWWRQDQAFIPVTINSALLTPAAAVPGAASMPTSLGGRAGSSVISLGANSRPIDRLTVNAKYRRYDFRDEANATALPVMIINDRAIAPADTARRDPFSRDNADVSARLRLWSPISVNAGYAWERVELANEERNTEQYLEHTPSVGVDFTGNRWMSLRTRYSKAKRRNDGYHYETGFLETFRRLDLADRDRERIVVIADVTPLDELELSGTWKIGHDGYPNSAYGVQTDRSGMIGGDVAWYPADRFTVSAGWTREDFKDRFRGRYRTPTMLNNTTFDWVANNNDVVTTASASIAAVLIPDRFEAGAQFEASRTRFLMLASNPTPPSGGTASDIASATAYNYPEITQRLQPFNAYARYRMSNEWAATVRFQSEGFRQNDFRNLNLAAAPGTGNNIFLGNTFQNYNARYITLSLTWRPTRLRLARSTI